MRSAKLTLTIELVRQAQSGDRAALDRLFARYYTRVLRVVRIRMGRRLRRDLESADILHDVFAVAVRKFDDFEMRDEASFLTWLRTIVERQIIGRSDWQGAQARDRAREVARVDGQRDGPEDTIEPADPSAPPLDNLIGDETQHVVEAELALLDESHRDVVILRSYEGHGWEQIAELTERPSGDAARMMYATAMLELGKRVRQRYRKGDRAEPG